MKQINYKKAKGFGQISVLSIVLFLAFIVGSFFSVKKYIEDKKEIERENQIIKTELVRQSKQVEALNRSAQLSQEGLAQVELRSDEAVRDSKELEKLFDEMNLQQQGALMPQETEELINEITRKQLEDLENITQKNWVPKKPIDEKD